MKPRGQGPHGPYGAYGPYGPYGPFDYSPMPRRAPLAWPQGARVALWVIPNIEFFSIAESIPAAAGGTGAKPPDVPSWSARDYGNRVGELVSVPYSLEINDKPAYEKRNRTANEFRDMIERQFEVLYEEGAQSGRVMAISLHPYLSGVPHRIGALDAALEAICRRECVWRATGSEIAREFRRQAAQD